MLSNLKTLDTLQLHAKNPATLTPSPNERTTGVTSGITVVLNGYDPNEPSNLLFTVSSANEFRCSIEGGAQAITLNESSIANSTTIHYSVDCGQNLESTRWVFTLKIANPVSTTPVGTFVFSKAKADKIITD